MTTEIRISKLLSATPKQLDEIDAILIRGVCTVQPPMDRLLRRRDAAKMFGCTLRTIDRWCKIGLLPRVKLPGFSRASGIRESDLLALIKSSN